MVQQFPYWKPLIWIFLQTRKQKIFALAGDLHIIGDLYLIFDNFDEVFFLDDLEWVFAHQHFVHHDSQWPYINFLVVLLALEDLGPDVQRGATECSAEVGVAVDRPPEIAQLYHALRLIYMGTSWMTIFSGFMSRWIMRWEWSSFTAWQTCLIIEATFCSGIDWCFFNCLNNCPPVAASMIR